MITIYNRYDPTLVGLTSNYFFLCTYVNKKCYYTGGFKYVYIYTHDEVHVINVVNGDKACCIQDCWLHINGCSE